MLPSCSYLIAPVLIMSLLLQTVGLVDPQHSGVIAWRCEMQQAELACDLINDFLAHYALVSSGMVAAGGQSLALPR